ncbi:hypothetical protein [Streptomyces sp. NPDC055085]
MTYEEFQDLKTTLRDIATNPGTYGPLAMALQATRAHWYPLGTASTLDKICALASDNASREDYEALNADQFGMTSLIEDLRRFRPETADRDLLEELRKDLDEIFEADALEVKRTGWTSTDPVGEWFYTPAADGSENLYLFETSLDEARGYALEYWKDSVQSGFGEWVAAMEASRLVTRPTRPTYTHIALQEEAADGIVWWRALYQEADDPQNPYRYFHSSSKDDKPAGYETQGWLTETEYHRQREARLQHGPIQDSLNWERDTEESERESFTAHDRASDSLAHEVSDKERDAFIVDLKILRNAIKET